MFLFQSNLSSAHQWARYPSGASCSSIFDWWYVRREAYGKGGKKEGQGERKKGKRMCYIDILSWAWDWFDAGTRPASSMPWTKYSTANNHHYYILTYHHHHQPHPTSSTSDIYPWNFRYAIYRYSNSISVHHVCTPGFLVVSVGW